MGGWLKDKYKELLINGLISAMCVLLGFWAYGFRQSSNNSEARFKRLETQKAEVTYVNEQCLFINSQLDKKADKSVVESMDHKLDLILMKLK